MKHQEIKDIVAASYKFLQEVPSKLEIQCKRLCVLFDFGWCSTLSVRNGVSNKVIS